MPTTKTTQIQGDELAELDFVAFLAALGFDIVSRRRLRRYDLTDGADDKVLGLWTVSQHSRDAKHTLRDLRARWAMGVPDKPRHGQELDIVAVSRLALHNFRALTQLGKHHREGCPLYSVPLGSLIRLNNERSFADARPCENVSGSTLPSMGTSVAAVAITMGCPLLGYTPATTPLGSLYLRWCVGKGSAPLADPGILLHHWRDERWLLDETNDTPLAVAMMTLKNRRALLADTFAPRELTLLSRLERRADGADGALALIDPDKQPQLNKALDALGM